MSTKPSTTDEGIQAVAVKLKELRSEAKETEQRLRAEMQLEIARLRAEFEAEGVAAGNDRGVRPGFAARHRH
jgi:hypothetical protein